MKELRRNYEMKSLELENLAVEPIAQFERWFDEAQAVERPDWLEINAMTLATYDKSAQQVAARIVLLKFVDDRGFTFFTNYDSDKGRQLGAHPQASLVIYWPHVERQVRVQGHVTLTDAATSTRYFHARPRASQLGAAASHQSTPVADRQVLEQEVARLDALYQGIEVPRPDAWGGYVLRPTAVEFWQGRRDRLHDRFLYRQIDDEAAQTGQGVYSGLDGGRKISAAAATRWTIERLSP